MDERELWARAFNLWMDEYVNDPAAFESTTATALRHLRESLDGRPPTYGESSAVTFGEYVKRAGEA